MALTRKLLKGMGLTDEQVDTIIEAHTDTVDGLKADIGRYKADAEKLPGIQKELDDLKRKTLTADTRPSTRRKRKTFRISKTELPLRRAPPPRKRPRGRTSRARAFPPRAWGW